MKNPFMSDKAISRQMRFTCSGLKAMLRPVAFADRRTMNRRSLVDTGNGGKINCFANKIGG